MRASFSFNDREAFLTEDYHFREIPIRIATEHELFYFYAWIFNFPNWFGCNWDALADCLIDLDDIKSGTIVIYHADMPNFSKEKLKIYIRILNNTINHWNYWPDKQAEKRKLIIAFPEKCEKPLKELIDQINFEERESPDYPWPKEQHSY